MASRSINIYTPLSKPARPRALADFLPAISRLSHGPVMCSTMQESSTATAATVTEQKESERTAAEAAAPKAKKALPKKAPAKPLPEMMEEEVIPVLRTALESREGLSQIELSFRDNTLEGSFLKNGIPYNFWAFFPSGALTGPKGFALCSHGNGASTVEPFLNDEKRITSAHVVFWVEKRLAAQGILPVWNE